VAALHLTELELDALTELVNIGVSRAAASLRVMIGKQVYLSVPSIEIVDTVQALALIGERETDQLVVVRQDFAGAFGGRALLIFPQASSLELVRAVLRQEDLPEDAGDMEKEALAETGNVILNGCLGSMANMLRKTIVLGLPEVLYGSGPDVLDLDAATARDEMVMFLYINFSVQERDIRGYIAMLMGMPSLDALKQLVREFIASVMDDESVATG
jgi:chemotaxis protein CheC